jgi:hypothetical protein
MAPPPKYLITRRLVKRFFDRFLPRAPTQENAKMQQMWKLYEKYGPSAPVCKAYESIYDQEYSDRASFNRRVDSLKLKQSVTSKLTKPLFKIQVKGRFKKDFNRPPPSIFDGVK